MRNKEKIGEITRENEIIWGRKRKINGKKRGNNYFTLKLCCNRNHSRQRNKDEKTGENRRKRTKINENKRGKTII
jgi:hypothetical protein